MAAPYTATLVSAVADDTNGNIVATVRFTNQVRSVDRRIVAADLDRTLKTQCLKIAQQLQAQDTAVASLVVGPIVF